jgi:hypothetical protein
MWILSRLLLALILLTVSAWAQRAVAKPKNAGAQTCGQQTDSILILKCPRFGFTYKLPFGWVDRTDDMQSEEPEAKQTAAARKSETLLAIFERPPGAPGDTINSAVVIATEPLANYPAIKSSADYFGPITDLALQDGFRVVNEPQPVQMGAKQLVRGDFMKERSKLTMWQSSLVMIEKGTIISFTFVGGSEDEVKSLIGNLNFRTPSSRPPSITY